MVIVVISATIIVIEVSAPGRGNIGYYDKYILSCPLRSLITIKIMTTTATGISSPQSMSPNRWCVLSTLTRPLIRQQYVKLHVVELCTCTGLLNFISSNGIGGVTIDSSRRPTGYCYVITTQYMPRMWMPYNVGTSQQGANNDNNENNTLVNDYDYSRVDDDKGGKKRCMRMLLCAISS